MKPCNKNEQTDQKPTDVKEEEKKSNDLKTEPEIKQEKKPSDQKVS